MARECVSVGPVRDRRGDVGDLGLGGDKRGHSTFSTIVIPGG